uniref:Mce/MlaD domain-containing protein n=1 Tax=Periphykon beckeri TaxID=2006982 RepID=A0A1Z1M2R5_9FLOR|nr:hypothetical protein [Periphykon beckeri]ARW60359.1 hypothetical protein [Periphykon beckeri]
MLFFKKLLTVLFFILFIFSFSFIGITKNNSYSLFLEFNDAYGLKEGTSVNLRGVKIGYVNRITINLDKVILLLTITNRSTIIHKNSIFEATQIGLFNDIVVNVTPLNYFKQTNYAVPLILHKDCLLLPIICPNSYIIGYKGINYDDLIRATTRISQRFDDPRFFHLIYLLLKNSITISDELLLFCNNSSNLLLFLAKLIKLLFL